VTWPPDNQPPVIDYRAAGPPRRRERWTWLLFFAGLLGGSALSFALLMGGVLGKGGGELLPGWIAIKLIAGVVLCCNYWSRPAGIGLILSVPFSVLVFFVGCAIVISW
jgi:hypothetical protein